MKCLPAFSLLGIICISLPSLVADPSTTPSNSPHVILARPSDSVPDDLSEKMAPASPPVSVPLQSPASSPQPRPTSSPGVKKPITKPSSKTPKQQKGVVSPELIKLAANEHLTMIVSLSKQRVYLLVGGKVAVDSPISSGRKDGWTPKGEFTILEKDPDHRSNLYGDFVDESGKTVRSGISSKVAPPAGMHYRGASMKYFMRLTPEGVGMHAGILPGYPASHGCIRLPLDMAQLIYNTVSVKVPVSVTD